MTTKLQLYKRAALHLKQTPPSSLTEDIECRRIFDVHYDDVLKWFLENGFWTSAMRTMEITENTDITPGFGYSHVHDFPADYVRKHTISLSEFMDPPLDNSFGGTGYLIENNQIWTDSTPIYMRYVSNDSLYGTNLDRWTDKMAEAFSLELAVRSAGKLTGSEEKHEKLKEQGLMALGVANVHDSLEQPTQMGRQGRWVGNRFGRRTREYNRA